MRFEELVHLVWWMRELLQNKKERLVIGGLGLERPAMVLGDQDLS